MASAAAGPSTTEPKVSVHILKGKSARRAREMTGSSLLIGSGPRCDIQMRSVAVANRHCEIIRTPRRVFARSLDTSFPLLVNGESVYEADLDDRDTLTIGPFELQVTIEGRSANGAAEPEVPTDLKISALARIVRQHPPSSSTSVAVEETSARSDTRPSDSSRGEAGFIEIHAARRELARREYELAERERSLVERERALEQAAHANSAKRLSVADELLELDRSREANEKARSKLLRVRGRLFSQYRARHRALGEQAKDLRARGAQLDNRQRELEAELAHWRRVGAEVDQRQDQVQRRADELELEKLRLLEKEKNLAAREADLAANLARLGERQAELVRLEAELDARTQRIGKEDERARGDRQAINQERERLEQFAAEARHRVEAVEAKARVLADEEARLHGVSARLDAERLAQTELSRELGDRAAQVESARVDLEQRRIQIENQTAELNVLIAEQKERATLLERLQAEIDRRERRHGDERGELDKRSVELEEHAKAIFDRFELERQQLAARKQELQLERAELTRQREELESKRTEWTARAAWAEETFADVCEREEITLAETKKLEAMRVAQDAMLDNLRREELALQAQRDGIERERSAIDQERGAVGQTAATLEAQSTRLSEQASELEARQRELVERENGWYEELKRRRAELERLAADIEQKRAQIATQAQAQRRHLQKLREIGRRTIARRKQSSSIVERMERQQSAHQRRLGTVLENQRAAIERARSLASQAARREHEAAEALRALRERHQELAAIEERLARQVSAIGAAPAAGSDPSKPSLAEVAGTLGEFSAKLRQSARMLGDLEAELEQGERAIQDSERELNQLLAEIRTQAPKDPVPLRIVGAAEDAGDARDIGDTNNGPAFEFGDVLPALRRPTIPDPAADIGDQIADDALEALVREAVLVTEQTLAGARQSAARRGVSLASELVSAGKLTRYQWDCLVQGKPDRLRLGSATVLDLVHQGSVSTLYRARLPEFDEPVALRVYAARWSRDPAMRLSIEAAIGPLKSFRDPRVARTLGLVSIGDQIAVATEFVDGASLAELALYPCEPMGIVSLCQQVASALAGARRAGFVHHDLRPSRIRVRRDRQVKLVGYGEPGWLAKIHACESGRSHAIYRAPEELSFGAPVDIRADVYSLSQIFLELATGGQSRHDRAAALGPGYPAEFGTLLRGLAAPQPEKRTPDIDEVAKLLERMMAEAGSRELWPDLGVLVDEIAVEHHGRFAA